MAYKKRQSCAVCGSKELHTIMDYGKVPLAGYFPDSIETVNDHQYDMQLQFCSSCSLVQTDSVIDADTLFKDYRYMSSIGLSGYFTGVAKLLVERYNPHKVLEIGSNDGVLLLPLSQFVDCVGVDPAHNVVAVAKERGCNVIEDYFNDQFVIKHGFEGQFDIVVANNCFAHIDDIHAIVKGAKLALTPEHGRMVIEVHYIQDLIDKSQYETVYHEHLYYYSVNAMARLFEGYGMSIESVERIPIHGGSIRVVVKNVANQTSAGVLVFMQQEVALGLTSLQHFQQFGQQSVEHINGVKELVKRLKSKGARIVGYGASGRGNIFAKLCDFKPSQIDYIVDESPERIGRYTPSTGIPIVSKETLDNDQPDYVLIFAWNYSKMIINKLQGRGFKYIIAFPEPVVVESGDDLDPKIFI